MTADERVLRRTLAKVNANANGLPELAALIRRQGNPAHEAAAILALAFIRRAEAINQSRG